MVTVHDLLHRIARALERIAEQLDPRRGPVVRASWKVGTPRLEPKTKR